MYNTNIKLPDAPEAIPVPKGYKVLVAIPGIEEKTAGGIIRPDILRDQEKVASIFGYVVSMGDLAYGDPDKFPTGPWCKIGDWVLFRAYSGTRLKIKGQEFRLINDDAIEGTVDDPRTVERA